MSISDRLDEIESDAQSCMEDHPADPNAVELAMKVPSVLAALRAVLDVCEKSELGMYPEPRYDEYIPGQLDTVERIRNAIAAVLGEGA